MHDFDSPAAKALVEQARAHFDDPCVSARIDGMLAEAVLTDRDRGSLLMAKVVLLQGTLSSEEAGAIISDAISLLNVDTDIQQLVSALSLAAALSARSGDRAVCLKHCLEMSSLIRSHPTVELGHRASVSFGAALLVLGAYDLAAPLFATAIQACLDSGEEIGLVATCVNLAMVVSRKMLVTGTAVATDDENLAHLDLIERSLDEASFSVAEAKLPLLVTAVLARVAQLRGDLSASVRIWGDLDALTAEVPESFVQYLCLVEAPIAAHRRDLERALVLVERTLVPLPMPHIVPLGQVDALKIRSAIHEQTGDLAGALHDAKEATELVLRETSGLADLLIAQIDERAALEESQRALLDQTTHLSHQANVDELSQVGNRRAYEAQLATFHTGPERPLAVLLCDIDGLKAINDQHGHDIGDRVISAMGKIATDQASETSRVYRYGGDEFILLCDPSTGEQAHDLAQRIRTAFISYPWNDYGDSLRVSCSIGVWAGTSRDFEQGVTTADRQMYEAKKSGRDAVRVAPPTLTSVAM